MDAVPSSSAAPPRTEGSLWSELREALRGTQRDLTEAPLGRAIFVLAVPMVLEMVMESVFAVTDIFFVGRLGAEAQATVGLTETMETMVYALAFGLSIGATLARRPTHGREGRGVGGADGGPGDRAGAALRHPPVRRRGVLRAGPAPGDGRLAVGPRARRSLHPGAARSKRLGVPALPDQRHLPGCRRRSDRHARAVACQRHQHRARSVPRLRGRALPPAGSGRRGRGDLHRSDDGSHLSAVPADPWRRPADRALAARPPRGPDHALRPPALRGGHAPDRRRDDQLDRPRADHLAVRERGRGRLHHRHPTGHLRHPPLLRAGQRSGHARRAEPRRQEAGPGRARGVDRRRHRRDLPRHDRRDLHRGGAAHRRHLHRRSGGARPRSPGAADRSPRGSPSTRTA